MKKEFFLLQDKPSLLEHQLPPFRLQHQSLNMPLFQHRNLYLHPPLPRLQSLWRPQGTPLERGGPRQG